MSSNVTIKSIVENELCIGCGFCRAVCPADAIHMVWTDELFWKPEIYREKCIDCGECKKICPNAPNNIHRCAEAAFKEGEGFGLKSGAKHFIGYDLNEEARRKSASGGVLTAVLKHLLEKGKVKGVLTSVSVPAVRGEPHYEVRVLRSVDELEMARSSHYYPVSYEKALKEISQEDGDFAFVGVPCSIRAAKLMPPALADRIRYTLGLVCSHNVTGRFTDCLARQEGVLTGEKFTADLRNKDGGIKDANNFNNCFTGYGREIRVNRFNSAFTAMWRNYFFARECCLYCPDFFGAQADMSVKDAWGRLSVDPLGISLISVRTEEMEDVLSVMGEKGLLSLERCGSGEVIRSQPQTPRFKQVEVLNRIRFKPILRRKFSKQTFKHDLLKKNFTKNVIEYFYFRLMIAFSNFFYPLWGRNITKAIVSVFYVSMKGLSLFAKIMGLGVKVINGLISPLSYVLWGKIRYSDQHILPKENRSDKELKVVILGGYGYGNVGDEAQLARVIQNWKRLCPVSKLTILSPNPEYTERVHGERSEPAPRAVLFESRKNGNYVGSNIFFKWRYLWIKPRILRFAKLYRDGKNISGAYPEEIQLLRSISEADVLHFGGGGYLTGMTLSRLWDGMLIMNVADIFSTSVILSGQTMGVFRDRRSEKLAKWGLSKAKVIYLRDPEGSRKDLERIGVESSKINVTFDDALFCETAGDEETSNVLLENGISPGDPYVVVNVHHFKQGKEVSRRCMEQMAAVSDHMISDKGFQIVFLPLVPSDVKAIEETRRKMKQRAHIIDYEFDYRVAKGVISKAEFMLTMKHHGIIFAMGSKIPTIAVALDDYYIRKNLGALKLFGQERFMLDGAKFFDPKILENKIEEVVNNKRSIMSEISSHLDPMKVKDGEMVENFLKDQRSI